MFLAPVFGRGDKGSGTSKTFRKAGPLSIYSRLQINFSNKNRLNTPFKGAGGGEVRVDFHVLVVSYRREWHLPGTFIGMKKYCSYPKLSEYEISKIHTIKLRTRNLIAIPRQSTIKSISSYSFWDKSLKLGSYVLRTKTKLLKVAFRLKLTKNAYLEFSNFDIFTSEA